MIVFECKNPPDGVEIWCNVTDLLDVTLFAKWNIYPKDRIKENEILRHTPTKCCDTQPIHKYEKQLP